MTEHKQIEQAVKECQDKFLNLFRVSPVVLTISTAKDHRYIEVNDAFERYFGWTRHEVIGRTAFDLGLWEEPNQRVDLVKQLLSGGIVRNLQFRARMKNGDIRTSSLSAILVEINDRTCVLCLVTDLTDFNRAEEAKRTAERLSIMGHKLIQAHEEERKSIAGELHEYVERLILLSIDPERLGKIEAARQQIEDLVMSCQALSRRLRSVQLEYLGLPAAVASFCKELSDRKKVEIEFASEGTPQELPDEVSLSLYRVLQEALQNATSHSGSKRIQVMLRYTSNEVDLSVRDSGIGFDTVEALKGPEVGLTIMQERLKMVGGEFLIESQPERGTTIHARVPLNSQYKSERVVV